MRLRTIHFVFLASVLTSTSFAREPALAVHDKRAKITRQSFLNDGFVDHTICVTRPRATRNYVPGRLTVDLSLDKPYFLRIPVALAGPPSESGEECFEFSLDSRQSAVFEIDITDQTRSNRPHQFFLGRVEAIPELDLWKHDHSRPN